MSRSKKSMIASFLLAIIMLFVGTCTINASAAGEETLPVGSHYIGNFTFTDTNLTKIKTMPNGAQTLRIGVKFRKSPTDAGIGQVKLTVQIRDTNGHVITTKVVNDITGYINGTNPRYTVLLTDEINVSAGQKYQIFFDASSVNPSQSNGNYRSIQIMSFDSFINVSEVQY